MQGPTIKTYFAKKKGIDPKSIVNVALTPCTAKKFEIRRDEMNASAHYLGIEGMRDMDYVITTRELAKWAKEEGIDFASLEDGEYDNFMGEASGAGIIFGNTGGVMEAALRTAYEFITKEKSPEQLFNLTPVRGYEGVKEATLKVGDLDLNIAVVYGTANAGKVIEGIKQGEKQYHFVAITPSFTHGEYWEAISDGIDKAASEMESYNITITKLFFDQYNNKTFDDIVRNLLDEKVDGVLIATLFTDSVIRLSQELDRNEIPYVYVDSNIEGQHQLAYFGTESYDAGVIAARLLTDKISSTSDILMARIIHSGKNDSNQGKNRREGFCHYLKETGFTGNLHEVELKINDSVYNFIKLDEIFEANATIEGGIIFNSTCYILGNYLKARGMQKVKLVGYDLIERNTQLLSDGVITALVAQRPERQGYDGIKSLCNHLLFKQNSEKVNLMPIDILLKENLKYYLNNKL